MKVTAAIRPDTRYDCKNSNDYPLCIRVTFKRKPIFFPIGERITKADFSKLFDVRVREELAKKREKAKQRLKDADEIIRYLNPFEMDSFREHFYKDEYHPRRKKKKEAKGLKYEPSGFANIPLIGNTQLENQIKEFKNGSFKNQYGKQKYPKQKSTINYSLLGEVAKVYGELIKLYEIQKRTGSLTNLFNSLISMLSFKTNLKFREITPLFLEQYQSWMEAKGNTLSTIGFYLRPLRNVFNTAIDNRIIQEKLYPFGRRRYIIPSGDNIKKAICTESLNKLYYHVPSCNQEEIYRDFWFFIYFGNGMNMKDVALLKYGKINGDWIYFNRAKTERTAKGKRRIVSVYLSDDMKRIIDHWGNKDKAADNYIFPILRNGLDQYAIRDKVQLFIKRVNFWMGVIAKSEGVEEAVLTMSGRHAFATQLRDADVNKEFIREALGQIDSESIDHYFAKFQNDSHIGYVTNLESFKGNRAPFEISTEQQIKMLLEQLSKLMKQKTVQKSDFVSA